MGWDDSTWDDTWDGMVLHGIHILHGHWSSINMPPRSNIPTVLLRQKDWYQPEAVVSHTFSGVATLSVSGVTTLSVVVSDICMPQK